MRRLALIPTVLAIFALALWAATPAPAQAPHPLSRLSSEFGPHKHLPPAPVNAPSTPAVIFDATHLGSPVILKTGWRVGVTSNSAAAAPQFDDSAWVVRNVGDSLDDLRDEDRPANASPAGETPGPPPGHTRPSVWFRLHIQLQPGHGPVALLTELPVSPNTAMPFGAEGPAPDVYLNGRLLQPEGPNGYATGHFQEISRFFNLNIAPTDTSATLAIRSLYIPFGLAATTGFFSSRTFWLGNSDDLRHMLELWKVHSLFERLPRLVNAILLTVLSLFLLILYFTQKGHIEYLWLALYELLQAPIGFIELAGSTARIDHFWYAAVMTQLLAISAYLYFEFLIAFLRTRRRWYVVLLRFTAPILAGVGPTLLMLGHRSTTLLVVMAIVLLASLLWFVGWLLFVFLTLIFATVRRNFEAGLLLIPLVLSLVGIGEPILSGGMSDWGGKPYHSPLTIQAGLIPIHFAAIADFAGLLVIVMIIFGRFLRIQHDQEHASSELAAARSVQELMIPQEKLDTPGYDVESVYNPANEVGGDFFHVQPASDGGLLVVVGDVAGKGLKAAMNVSMLMGALRGTPEKSPAKILESLNRVLVGSESLTTCQALRFSANGELVMANAGHLPPYLNSQEVALPGSLPLGAIPDVSYEEVRLYLHPGDRLLLLSDGVVEARQPSGELFGFDRVHNLSNQTAFYIADAAREFGQEDDITVLTVKRLAAAMAA